MARVRIALEELDKEALADAARALGTTRAQDTVDRALAEVARVHRQKKFPDDAVSAQSDLSEEDAWREEP